ncbi:MAG: hypothetical protein ACRCX8_16195 [Sarcina sp.]
MLDFKEGSSLPEEFIGITPEGFSGTFSQDIVFILKIDEITEEEIEIFKVGSISADLLELDMFKQEIGNVYAFSILIDGFIDNSEVMLDFRVPSIESIMPKTFIHGAGIDAAIILVDGNDIIKGIREFKFDTEFSNLVSEKAYKQNAFISKETHEDRDYIIEIFQKLFEREPEENVSLYSIGRAEFEN